MNFLQYLFTESQVEADMEAFSDEALGRILEGLAASADLGQHNFAPLSKALSALGLSAKVEDDGGVPLVTFATASSYALAMTVLRDPDGMHKLAELGWVASPAGDATGGTPAAYAIHFLCVDASEADGTENGTKVPDLDDLLKDAEKESSTQSPSSKENEKAAKIGEATTSADLVARLLAE